MRMIMILTVVLFTAMVQAQKVFITVMPWEMSQGVTKTYTKEPVIHRYNLKIVTDSFAMRFEVTKPKKKPTCKKR